jgi:hypothetical protein
MLDGRRCGLGCLVLVVVSKLGDRPNVGGCPSDTEERPMTDYPRTHWQSPSQPVTGPAKKAATTLAVAHWSGSSNIPTDKAAWLRAMQADWLRRQPTGYSLGYWWMVCQNGDSYQIRGPELNSAANKGDKVAGNANDWTAPILFDVRPDERLTPAAIATARRLWNSVGVYTRPVPHHELDPTQCCGPHLTAQIAAGELDNPSPAPPEPQPVPPSGANVLNAIIRLDGTLAVYAQYSGGYKVWIRNGDVLNAYRMVTGQQVRVIPATARPLFEASGPIIGDRPPGVDAYGLPV